jgi:hypothetical protein
MTQVDTTGDGVVATEVTEQLADGTTVKYGAVEERAPACDGLKSPDIVKKSYFAAERDQAGNAPAFNITCESTQSVVHSGNTVTTTSVTKSSSRQEMSSTVVGLPTEITIGQNVERYVF